MSLLWNLLWLGGSAYAGYLVFAGLRDGRISARFGVYVGRKEDPLMFWVVAAIWSLISFGLLLLWEFNAIAA